MFRLCLIIILKLVHVGFIKANKIEVLRGDNMETVLVAILCGLIANAYEGTRVEVLICVLLGVIANQLVQINRKQANKK
jgi:hypothetical protein